MIAAASALASRFAVATRARSHRARARRRARAASRRHRVRAQEGDGVDEEWPRFQPAVPRREEVRRGEGAGRIDHRSSAREQGACASSAREREREPRARGDARDPRIQGFRERVESGVQRRATPTRGSSNAVNDSKIARFSRFDRALTRARAFRRSQFHAGDGVGTGKDFTLFALRDGEVMFKVGANKKKFVTVVDAVDRSGRADGQPTRKDKRKAMYSPRAVVRAAQEEGISAPGVERVAR